MFFRGMRATLLRSFVVNGEPLGMPKEGCNQAGRAITVPWRLRPLLLTPSAPMLADANTQTQWRPAPSAPTGALFSSYELSHELLTSRGRQAEQAQQVQQQQRRQQQQHQQQPPPA